MLIELSYPPFNNGQSNVVILNILTLESTNLTLEMKSNKKTASNLY